MSSPFADILEQLVRGVPGVVGAVFADWEGEPVDQFSLEAADEIQIMGAQWGVTVAQINQSLRKLGAGSTDELWIEADRAVYFLLRVTDAYFVVLFGKPGTHLGNVRKHLQAAVQQLRDEM